MNYLDYYRKKFYLFYKFAIEKEGSAFFIEQVKELVDINYKKGNVKKLAKINKELDVWLREMFRPNEKEEILQIIKTELKEDNELIFHEQVCRVIKNGKINTKEEYEIILQSVDEIYSDYEKISELTKLNELIVEFHRKKMKW